MNQSQARATGQADPLHNALAGADGDPLTSGVLRFLSLLDAEGLLDEPQALRAYLVEVRGDPARLALALAAAVAPAEGGRSARAEGPDAQTLRILEDLRSLRTVARREREARELAEAQQLRLVQDFRLEHRRALDLAERLDRAYLETISALARSVEARDAYTGGHVERVRSLSVAIGGEAGMDEGGMRHLEYGAVLHDVGKVGIPDAILGKAGPLQEDEWEVMRRHPELGCRVLEGVSFLVPALDAVAHHHERWDGRGYPAGRAGTDIPLLGRIVAVADAYDAMTLDRPYRSALSRSEARAEIEAGRGGQFDPDLAAAFLRLDV